MTLDHNIPKRIWFYWHQGLDNAPELVRRCHRSWVIRNPGWDVVDVDASSLPRHLDGVDLPAIRPQALSDLIRINLLCRYGGVWTDASCLCVRTLDDWIGRYVKSSGFFAFSDPAPDRLVASWFLASAEDHYVTSRWAEASNAYWSGPTAPTRMVPSVRLSKRMTTLWPDVWFTVLVKDWLGIYPYHWFHYHFRHLYVRDPRFMASWDATPRFAADVPHAALRKGLTNPIDDEFRREVDERVAPMYKLNWRKIDKIGTDSVLYYLYQTL